jgi:hypothetical protein
MERSNGVERVRGGRMRWRSVLLLMWLLAQNAANGNATTVYANSYIKLTRIQ